MTVYTADMSNFYEDENGVSDFTGDDTSETVIVADALSEEGPRVFTIHFVEIVAPLVPRHAMLRDAFIVSDGTSREAFAAGGMVNV